MDTSHALDRYAQMRDFSRTPEPPPVPAHRGGPLTFTIQKHAARRLHYDFRLEIDGVLVSWPIPKGPAYNPLDRRLAIQTEDHPYEYGTFEGVIPAGEYGGGQVIVWDAGTYSVVHDNTPLDFHDRHRVETLARKGVESGHLSIFLNGRKLKGGWTLQRTRGKGVKSQWLFLKRRDGLDDARLDITAADRSVLSGLSIEDLARGTLPQRQASQLAPTAEHLTGVRSVGMPRPYEPMLPTLSRDMFQRADWLYEPKLDGYRLLAFVDGGRVHLRSRGGQAYEERYPELVRWLGSQPVERAVFDGEVVAIGADGRMSFQRLQNRSGDPAAALRYYVFDLLYLDGFDLRGVALVDRKRLLHAVLAPLGGIEEVAAFDDGARLFQAAGEQGFEGVVAKKRDSVYEPGARVRTWLKVKTSLTDDFVVVGYTLGTGRRSETLGSLILGSYDQARTLRYAGHVGTGFDEASLSDMLVRLTPLHRATSPLGEAIPRGAAASRAGGAGVWVEPRVVVEIKFSERTEDGRLRHPVFLRVREDKPAAEVQPQAVAGPPADVEREHANPSPGRPSGTGVGAEGQRGKPAVKRPYGSALGNNLRQDPIQQATPEIVEALQVLDADPQKQVLHLTLDGHAVRLSSLNKVLWPATDTRRALTKRDLIRYFLQIAPVVLPHLRDRPVTMTRFPDGIHAQRFYQKSPLQGTPAFVERFSSFSEDNNRDVEYFVCNNAATLIWLAQLADLELHVTHTRIVADPDAPDLSTRFTRSRQNVEASTLNYPDFLVTDLDPYIYSGREPKGAEPELNPEGFQRACEVALWYRDMLEEIGLHPFLKTTGRTGLHLYVPIARTLDYDSVRAVGETLARRILASHPQVVTTEWATVARRGKVFLDYNMNRRGASLAAVYSPRAVDWAGVSTPLRWEELDHAYPTQFDLLNIPERLVQLGDLWQDILESRVDLKALLAS
ncbi:MAG: non-homologous end-joining DNA ligase [Chloroflexi bacterium]|nr:non-homologous end-joining DNA ligase [Chloroflexota bacterium]